MIVKLLTERHLEFLSLTGGYTGWSESTLIKMPHCWKSSVAAQLLSMWSGKNQTSMFSYGHKKHSLIMRLYIQTYHLPFKLNGISHSYQFSVLRVDGWNFYFNSNLNRTFCKQTVLKPDQMPHSVAADLGLHCLSMSHKMDARLIWVNYHLINWNWFVEKPL